jgi:hypothetical protein
MPNQLNPFNLEFRITKRRLICIAITARRLDIGLADAEGTPEIIVIIVGNLDTTQRTVGRRRRINGGERTRVETRRIWWWTPK